MEILMKHIGSTAADLEIKYEINEESPVVELKTSAFDSALFASFFADILEQRNGIGVICDERTEWHPARPPYRVFLTMRGQRFEVTAYRQVIGGSISIALNPMPAQKDNDFFEKAIKKGI